MSRLVTILVWPKQNSCSELFGLFLFVVLRKLNTCERVLAFEHFLDRNRTPVVSRAIEINGVKYVQKTLTKMFVFLLPDFILHSHDSAGLLYSYRSLWREGLIWITIDLQAPTNSPYCLDAGVVRSFATFSPAFIKHQRERKGCEPGSRRAALRCRRTSLAATAPRGCQWLACH